MTLQTHSQDTRFTKGHMHGENFSDRDGEQRKKHLD